MRFKSDTMRMLRAAAFLLLCVAMYVIASWEQKQIAEQDAKHDAAYLKAITNGNVYGAAKYQYREGPR